ncbi:putative bifunctional diguanylate cyclase/phosphodiesterase [Solibaculum intestinale]|uniref:Bifunctional diguanylate cyclase/phosphodiesterase n=1 Tax=Solibaculum intestinale TaxID=3133165 RepID=A0ABV1DYR5_9FIRM
MSWHVEAEMVAFVIVGIILIYSREGNMLPTLKNRVFQLCLFTTFLSIGLNIASVCLIAAGSAVPVILTDVVNTLYFVATPAMALTYFYYTVAYVYEHSARIRRVYLISTIPYAVYMGLALADPATNWLFSYDVQNGYQRGPLQILPYVVFYAYCVGCLLITALRRKHIDPSIRRILYAFPLVAAVVIVVQQVVPQYILSGSAAACALLVIYLYLQNKRITVDPLTGLSNRQAYTAMLELRLRQKHPITVVVVSLMDFKFINDTFGQKSGDRVLSQIASFLSKEAAPDRVYRCGGDEFAVLMESETDADKRIRRMRKQFSQPWDVFGSGCMVYAGIGVARAWQLKLSVEELVSALECAVAEAKEGSTGRVVVCDDRMVARMKRKHAVTEILKEELLNQGFEVYYQPIYRCKDGGFPVAEALLRLPDTPLGPIYPDEFIPIAEETGLIVQMTYLVLAKVCKFVRRLLDEGAKLEGVSVNLSVLQFMQRDLADHIAEILDYYQIPARFIKLEITESVVASNYEAVLSVMEKLAKKGVQFALDDFGTGYSNLSYVMHLPVDMVKIDRSLIWSSLNNDRCATLVEAVSRTFGQAGIRMIAEGVETGEQAAFAQRCGIELIQGFLYAKPMPQEEALPYLMGVKELVNK